MSLIRTVISTTVISLSLAAVACDDSAKKAEEAKALADKAAAEAKAAADKAALEAKQAAEKAKKEFDDKRAAAAKKLTSQGEALDRKATAMKEKAGKLNGAAKAKAEKAMDEYTKARAVVTASLKEFESTTEAKMADATKKLEEQIAAAGKALDAFEAAVTGK